VTDRVLIVPTSSWTRPHQLAAAVAAAAGPDAIVRVLIPAVLPPTLPITACPPRVGARLDAQREAAASALCGRGRGSVVIAPARSVAALLAVAPPPDRLVLVGGAGWSLRRAARGLAGGGVTILPAGAGRARTPQPRPAART